jgi:hypothetical protein
MLRGLSNDLTECSGCKLGNDLQLPVLVSLESTEKSLVSGMSQPVEEYGFIFMRQDRSLFSLGRSKRNNDNCLGLLEPSGIPGSRNKHESPVEQRPFRSRYILNWKKSNKRISDCLGNVSFLKPLDDALQYMLYFYVHPMSPPVRPTSYDQEEPTRI